VAAQSKIEAGHKFSNLDSGSGWFGGFIFPPILKRRTCISLAVYMIALSAFKLTTLVPDNFLRWLGSNAASTKRCAVWPRFR
jgi:hypothetical protein